MANQFSITINNRSNSPQRFAVFQEVPTSPRSAKNDVFTNIYLASGDIQPGHNSNAKFVVKMQYYALYGATQQSDNGSTRVDTADSFEAKLGPSGSYIAMSSDPDGSPYFDKMAAMGKSVATAGAFTIATDNTIKYPNANDFYIGIGAKDPKSNDVVPIQTYVAKGGMNLKIYPKPIYHVCYGDYEPGTIVDRQGVGQVLTVDFSDASLRDAKFTLNNSGSYVDGNVKNSGIVFKQGELSI
ncbi:hypothetical protein CC86DRAFT_295274 [Ophiobolus disseminans]|uniref:Uncharacterized protein n=1 Tax=Ophiobolus disseminans TaxID=1469910 RepID=A0A6A6ZVL9_9PLEO|nr:hypothetical protein CC86DRAFT_295274 [Ophiobolus disseminans]